MTPTQTLEWLERRAPSLIHKTSIIQTRVVWRRAKAAGGARPTRTMDFEQPAARADHPCLEATSRAFDEAQFMRSRAALAALAAPDLTYVTGAGRVLDRTGFIDDVADAAVIYDPFVIRERRTLVLGSEGAIVSAQGEITGQANGQPFASRFRYADAFRKIGGRWVAVYVQVSPSKGP